jgi:predicted esterase
VGFSQGGVLASILCALQCEEPSIKFDFAIIVSAFAPSPKKYQELLEKHYDNMCPTLHIFGQSDSLISHDHSRELARKFKDSQTLEHKGGHYIPTSGECKPIYKNFLQKFLDKKGLDK